MSFSLEVLFVDVRIRAGTSNFSFKGLGGVNVISVDTDARLSDMQLNVSRKT